MLYDLLQELLEKIISKHEEDYEKIICLIANELMTTYKGLDCEYISNSMKEEANKYEELVELLTNRLTDIEEMIVPINLLLTSQENVMRSLKQISEQVDALQVNVPLPCNVTELLQVTSLFYYELLIVSMYIHIFDHAPMVVHVVIHLLLHHSRMGQYYNFIIIKYSGT